ncbi:prolyl oligopeptidase family serine peptidase [Natrarchaeobius sp. A-rgal3]|uniref:S9 family peptidase n=1 Tax=Natrarchaeobius versutus TaxID=1679078 RepID=UPI0035106842
MNELPADAIYDLTRPMEVAVSPDGSRVAFQVLEYDRAENRRRSSVFTVPADGSREPHRLTRVSDGTTVKWSPDGARLGVVMTRTRDAELQVGNDESGGDRVDDTGDDSSGTDDDGRGGGGDEPSQQLWVYDLERGGDARQVTDHDEGIRDFDWGPEGERVVVSARDPTAGDDALVQRRDGDPIEIDRLQHKFEGVGWRDPVSTSLFVVDLESRDRRRLTDASSGGILEPFQELQPTWHPVDDRIAFVANHGDDPDDTYAQDIHIVDAESDRTERLTAGEYMVGEPTWSPDGGRLAFPASDPTNWYVPTDVCVADADTGEYHVVTEDLDRDLVWFEGLVWLDDERLLTGIGDEGWSRFVRLSADGGHDRVYNHQSRDASLLQFDTDGETIAFARQHPRKGIDLFGVDVGALETPGNESDPARRLTELNPDLVTDYDHPELERLTFEGGRSDDVEGLAFYPPAFDPTDPNGDRPLLISIHGGPRRYDEPHFDFDTAFWTTRGYVVFKVNYHGSTSYGRAFCERLEGQWNDLEVDDVLAGADELIERGWVDPDRLFVTGFSNGGKTTAQILAKSDRFVAGAAEHGIYDMRSAFGTNDTHKVWENEFGLPWTDPDAYDAASVITDIDDIETPLLVTAGENDLRCPPAQAEQLYVSLKKRGIESKLIVYPDTNHVHYFVAGPDRATHRLETLSAWFERFDPTVENDIDNSDTNCG